MHLIAPSWFAAFLAFSAVPVILYLLFRRKRKDIPWGATYILRKLLETKSKISAWKQYVIIAVRTLAFVALPLFFMKPHSTWAPPTDGAFPVPPSSTHRCILIDVSQSMDAAHGSGRCLDEAVSLCRKAMQSAVFPGRIDILPLDGRTETLSFDRLPIDRHELETFVAGMERRSPGTDLEQGLRTALAVFRASPYEHKELYLLSDLSAGDFRSLASMESLFEAVRRLGVRIHTLSYENREANNFALLDFSPTMDLLLAGQPTIFYVTVGYYGAGETGDAWLVIRDAANETLYEETITLAQGAKTLEIPLALKAGEQTLTASLNDDDFAADNALGRTFRVSDQLRLLVVQDISLDSGFTNPREWLKLALAGKGSGKVVSDTLTAMIEHGKDLQAQIGKTALAQEDSGSDTDDENPVYKTAVDMVNSSQLGAEALGDRDGVILLDVDTLPEDAVNALADYARRGGMVFLAPGPKAAPERFNQTYAAISPCMLRPPVRDTIDPEIHESAILDSASDLLLRELESPKHGRIGNPRFYNHYAVDLDDAPDGKANVLFTLSGGDPLLVERPIGRGVCMLWTAGLGMDWHSMVVHPVYPVFYSRLFNVGAARRRFALNLVKGAPIIRQVDAEEVIIQRPDGQQTPVRTIPVGTTRILRYDATDLPGTYLVRESREPDAPAWRYNVREDRAESDYRPIDNDTRNMFTALASGQIARSERELFEQAGATYVGHPFMAWCAALALLCFVLEAGLARRWFT